MNLDLRPFLVLEIVLAMVVAVMIVWRKMVARHEDDSIHVLEDAAVVPQQAALAKKLDKIDKWGKSLTIVTVALGVLIGLAYAYQFWIASSTTIPGY